MGVLIPRIRTIGVRLSEEEYSSLEKFCVESGARSISDLARTAIYSFVSRGNQGSGNALVPAVDGHMARVRELEERIERLSAEIASFRAKASADPISE
jgi:hypothetical protein